MFCLVAHVKQFHSFKEKIKTEMKSDTFAAYEKKKRQLYDRYIDYRNKKVQLRYAV